ncbi:MAG: HNH endonuclease, partial [Clostridia bacterium]|nr:HNH endonuclease [Clostridia bacterium]
GFCEPWNYQNMQADHIIPWSKGGHTTLDNGQMLCRMHNLKKSDF